MTDHAARGAVLLAAGDFAGAENLLKARVHAVPDDAHAQLQLALAAHVRGDAALTERSARAALASDDTRVVAAIILASILDKSSGRLQEGLAWADYATRLAPTESDAWDVIAWRLREAGHKQQAIDRARYALQFLSVEPTIRAAQLVRYAGFCLGEPEWYAEGRLAARDAIALDPDNNDASRLLALLQVAEGRSDRGTVTLLDALHRNPAAPGATQHLTFALFGLGRRIAGWSILAAWLVNLVVFGGLSTLMEIGDTIRWTGAAGIVAMLATWTLCLRPLLRRGVRERVWPLARRRPHSWLVIAYATSVVVAYGLMASGVTDVALVMPFSTIVAWLLLSIPPSSIRRPLFGSRRRSTAA